MPLLLLRFVCPLLPPGTQQKIYLNPKDQRRWELLLQGLGLFLPGVFAGQEQRDPQVSGTCARLHFCAVAGGAEKCLVEVWHARKPSFPL